MFPISLGIDARAIHPGYLNNARFAVYTAIMTVCKQTLSDTLPILYGVNSLMLREEKPLEYNCLRRVKSSPRTTDPNLGLIRHVKIRHSHALTTQRIRHLRRFHNLTNLTLLAFVNEPKIGYLTYLPGRAGHRTRPSAVHPLPRSKCTTSRHIPKLPQT
jgi:hypothetical protein